MGVGADAGLRVLGGVMIAPSGFKIAVVSHRVDELCGRSFPSAHIQDFRAIPANVLKLRTDHILDFKVTFIFNFLDELYGKVPPGNN